MASSSLLWLLSLPADYHSLSLATDALKDKEEDRLLIFEGYKHKVQGDSLYFRDEHGGRWEDRTLGEIRVWHPLIKENDHEDSSGHEQARFHIL